ncbi:hypothetical protein C0993_010398, partial [Termitomyces sp. T159_Od127]
MTQHVESSQASESTIRTNSAYVEPGRHDESQDIVENTGSRAEACQKLIDEAVEGRLSVPEFIQALKGLGLNAAEARDHVDEVTQRIELCNAKARAPNPQQEDTLSSGEDQENNTGESHTRAVESAAWEALQERLEHAVVPRIPSSSLTIDQLAELLGDPKKTSTASPIPQSVLSAVPHLAELQSKISDDPHISRTWYLQQEYAKEKVVNSLINLGQSQPFKEPISRAMWKLVILDQFVDFDKLYATFDRGYDHADEPKDFMGGFSLIRKDYASAKKPVRTEYDWIRTFDAWMATVVLFYPHHEEELAKYRNRIMDFCHTIPNGTPVAIQFDIDMRDHYTRNPFHMDDDNRLHLPFLVQVLSMSYALTGIKCSSGGQFPPRKSNTDQQLAVAIKAQAAADSGPRSLKTAGAKRSRESELDAPISPSAQATESAPPLPSPSQHLMDNPVYQSTLEALKDSIHVETPFDVDRFEKLLTDHPNQPFVRSVMRSLREGFWPFDEGENWLLDGDNPLDNYATEEQDLAAIRSFRDKE